MNYDDQMVFEGLILCVTVFFPFLVKPLVKLSLSVFPKSSLNFFVNVVDESVKERKTAADDEEVCVNSTVFYFSG